MDPNTKKLVGAVVAAALAIAVYYGLIDQKQANTIQGQANQTLGTGPATQQPTTQQPSAQQPTAQQQPNQPAPTRTTSAPAAAPAPAPANTTATPHP